ncbi:MAG: hypothetical protein AAFV29_10760 [Myxococcota bacterium]
MRLCVDGDLFPQRFALLPVMVLLNGKVDAVCMLNHGLHDAEPRKLVEVSVVRDDHDRSNPLQGIE